MKKFWLGGVLALIGFSVRGVSSPIPVELTVDPHTVYYPAGRVVGLAFDGSTRFAQEGDPLHPDWRTNERVLAVEALREIQPVNGVPKDIRFGDIAMDGFLGFDGFHIHEYLDRNHPTEQAIHVMHPYEWMALVDAVGGTPLLTLNFGTGWAWEARDYYVYLNGIWPEVRTVRESNLVALRKYWGHPGPYGVRRFEIGNESYSFLSASYWDRTVHLLGDLGKYSYANPDAPHGGDPNWHGRPTSDPVNYAERCLEYIDTIHSDAAQFVVEFNFLSLKGWGGLDNTISALQPVLSDPRVRGVAVHNYLVDEALLEAPLFPFIGTDGANPELMLGAMSYFERYLVDIRTALDQIDREIPLEIAMTEFGVNSGYIFKYTDMKDTLVFGLVLADMMLTYLKTGVDQANMSISFNFDDPAPEEIPPIYRLLDYEWQLFNLFRKDGRGGILKMPGYWAQKIVGDHLLDDVVALSTSGNPDIELSKNNYSYAYPMVNAVALRSAPGILESDAIGDGARRGVTVLLLNRSLTEEVAIDLDVMGESIASASGVMLTSQSPMDKATEVSIEPTDFDVSIDDVTADETGRRQKVRFTIPPHTLVGVNLSL